jgi:hypothetical protein
MSGLRGYDWTNITLANYASMYKKCGPLLIFGRAGGNTWWRKRDRIDMGYSAVRVRLVKRHTSVASGRLLKGAAENI